MPSKKSRRPLLPAEAAVLRSRLETETQFALENIEMLVAVGHAYEGEAVDLGTLEGIYVDVGALIRGGREGVQ